MTEEKPIDSMKEFLKGRANPSPPVEQLPIEEFFKSEFIESRLIMVMGNMPQLPHMRYVDNDPTATHVTTFRHQFSPPIELQLIEPGEEMKPVEVIDPIEEQLPFGRWGYSILFTHENLKEIPDHLIFYEVDRKINALGYKLHHQLSSLLLNAYLEGEKLQIESWDNQLADPVKNILDAQLKLELDAFLTPNTIVLSPNNHRQIYERLITMTLQRIEGGSAMDVLNAVREIAEGYDTLFGMKLMKSRAISDNEIILFDEKRPAVTMWQKVDSDFSKTGLIHVEKEETDEGIVFNCWFDVAISNREPNHSVVLTTSA